MSEPSEKQSQLELRLKSRKLFQVGDMDVLHAKDGVYVFTRRLDDQLALVTVNSMASSQIVSFVLEPNLKLTNQIAGESLSADGDGCLTLTVAPMSSNFYLNYGI